MHQNHYFLRKLSEELHDKLIGYQLLSCFTQSKNEVILGFSNGPAEFYIKANLDTNQGLLSFTTEYIRAKRNTVDLFKEVQGQSVVEVRAHTNERSLEVVLDDDHAFVFKLFGRWSNLLLYRKNQVIALFKNKSNDLEMRRDGFDRVLDQSYEAFEASAGELKKIFLTFGKLVVNHLMDRGYAEKSLQGKWLLIQKVLSKLEEPTFYLIQDQAVRLSLLPIGKILEEHSSAIDAANAFHKYFFGQNLLEKEKATYLRLLQTKLNRIDSYISKVKSKIHELSSKQYNHLADILMANLHTVPSDQPEVELHNFYTDMAVKIKLNPKLSAQKNAEKYYQKSKNQGIELSRLQQAIKSKEAEKLSLIDEISEVEKITQLKLLRKKTTKEVKAESEINLPYNKFQIDEFIVLVGKNAKHNDRLTLNYAHKDDLWFHAKDVAGSHVVLKMIPGKSFPTPVIEKTAQLAAWFSKGKNFPLCPVIYTPKKYVRKPKGFAPGMVKVEREEVILVEPTKVTS